MISVLSMDNCRAAQYQLLVADSGGYEPPAVSELLTLGSGCCSRMELSRSAGTHTHAHTYTHMHTRSTRMINLSINAPFPTVSPPLFLVRFPRTETRACKTGVCGRATSPVCMCVCVCLICAIRAYSQHLAHHTTIAQLKCRTLNCGIQSPYSISSPYTTVSFHGMSISLHAGMMMAAGRKLSVERAPD